MPCIRCRHYTENGEPLQGGCRRKGSGQCNFVHPDDPRWRTAPPSNSGGRGRAGDIGSFRGGGGDRGLGRRGSAFVGGGKSAAASPGWDSSGSGWDTGGLGKGGSGRGTGGGEGVWSSGGWDQGGASGWNTGDGGGRDLVQENAASTTNKKTLASTAIADLTNEWQQATSTGWGTTTDVGNGWGSGGAGWATNSSSWSNTGWGDPGVDKETKEANPSEEKVRGHGKSEQNGKQLEGKLLPAPPRPPRPEIKMTGTNKIPVTNQKWGGGTTSSKPSPRVDTNIPPPRITSQAPSPQPPGTAMSSTSVITPAESSRLKRKHNSAFDEKLDQFKDLIKAWERAVRAQYLLEEAEANRERWYKTQKSAIYSRIGEAGRKKLDEHRADLDKEVLANRDKLTSAITALLDFQESISCSIDLSRRYDIFDEATKYITEAKAFIDHLRILSIDPTPPFPGPLPPQELPHHPPQSSGDFFLTLQRGILHLEERVEDAQTELTLHHPRDIATEVDEKINAKLEAVDAARQSAKDHTEKTSQSRVAIPRHLLEKMEETSTHVHKIDAQIPAIIEDVRSLIVRFKETKQRVEKLELDTASTRETVAKIHKQLTTAHERKRAQDEELRRLRDGFEQLTTSGPILPLVPSCDAQESITERLRPMLEIMIETFYEAEVRPSLNTISNAVLDSANRNHQETLGVMWEKMQPAMNVVEGMSRWLDSQELAMTAPRD